MNTSSTCWRLSNYTTNSTKVHTLVTVCGSGRSDSNRRHSAWKADVLPLNYTRSREVVKPPRTHARHLFVLVVNRNQPHGRGFGTTTCSLTGSKKPGGSNPSAPLAFRKQETRGVDDPSRPGQVLSLSETSNDIVELVYREIVRGVTTKLLCFLTPVYHRRIVYVKRLFDWTPVKVSQPPEDRIV